jgi:hypothetical protein
VPFAHLATTTNPQLEPAMTTETQPIRRRSNGAIDIDYYRNRALMEHKAVMADATTGAMSLGSLLVAAGLFIAAATATIPLPAHMTASTVTAALETR